jgi:hypothetical protein
MGGGGGGDGGAGKREKERQDRISQGYEQIRRIFEGSTSGVDEVPAFEVGGQYYTADGKPVSVTNKRVERNYLDGSAKPFNMNLRPNQFSSFADYRRAMDEMRYTDVPGYEVDGTFYALGNNPTDRFTKKPKFAQGGKLFSGVQTTPGFDDDFYNQREQAYSQFAMPQLEDQYSKAQEGLLMALARTGRLQSSTRGERFGDLQRDYDIQKTNVADKARQYAGDARSQVERARSDLVALNNSVADPTAIAQQASLSSNAMRTMPAFDPLAPLFQNVTEGIATQAELERRNAARYNTGFFAPSLNSGSGRVVR